MNSFSDLLFEDNSIEVSDCGAPVSTFELHTDDTISKGMQKLSRDTAGVLKEGIERIFSKAPDWLPFAAEKYLISPSLRDYVLVPIVILPSDLPNRNKVAFPFTELTAFNAEAGQLSYMTWLGKPTYEEHVNRDITKSKGVILDVSLRQMPGRKGNLWKVVALAGFDRGKDPVLASNIQKGVRTSYSMGALVNEYTCSVCGERANRKEQLTCGHVKPKGPFTAYETSKGNVLGHYNAHHITGFEVSSVGYPAWPSATTETNNLLNL